MILHLNAYELARYVRAAFKARKLSRLLKAKGWGNYLIQQTPYLKQSRN